MTAPVYLTFAQAAAIPCNGCGDCCDSRRTDGYWTWGALPPDGYRSLTGGEALVIPLERGPDGSWADRDLVPADQQDLTPTRFRCTAFRPQEDGRGFCSRHDLRRPPKCGSFPLGDPAIARDLEETGEARLNASAFPRCAWYGVVIVREGDPRLPAESILRG